jgi:uncharacterized protein YxjI
MKYIILIIFLAAVLLSCGFSDIKNESLKRPVFEHQKTLILDRYPVEIFPTYYVYSTKYGAFFDPQDQAEGTLYKINKNASIGKENFTVTDFKNKIIYSMKEENNVQDKEKAYYSISENGNKFCEIKAKFKSDFLKYDVMYKNELYSFEGKINQFSNIIHSIDFTLKDKDKILCSIYKQQYYFKDQYEVIINRKENPVDNLTYLSLAVFVDQVLNENGMIYKY